MHQRSSHQAAAWWSFHQFEGDLPGLGIAALHLGEQRGGNVDRQSVTQSYPLDLGGHGRGEDASQPLGFQAQPLDFTEALG
ncbi:hypothetical protein LOY67_09515 [Pseudomonas sp. B21-056]|uniref:hypothetical protein n=1 Tax=Pseudomonas sp. B21-056 TaxID=2895495 RepID=UPI002230331A|nr:hypothetical protein [Pseudomonas sp. B21-056]UZE25618.1 hypothetical protein LOY67_09515 [Pseudomonas sp. B21-056]